jgi:hypothetical protein
MTMRRNTGRTLMENRYWIGRKREAMGMARRATSAEARLVHYQLAGIYSLKAVRAAAAPLHAPSPEAPASVAPAGLRR